MLFPFPYLRNDKTTPFHIFRNKTAGITEDILEKNHAVTISAFKILIDPVY
jgi:hypothetical protein